MLPITRKCSDEYGLDIEVEKKIDSIQMKNDKIIAVSFILI